MVGVQPQHFEDITLALQQLHHRDPDGVGADRTPRSEHPHQRQFLFVLRVNFEQQAPVFVHPVQVENDHDVGEAIYPIEGFH